MHVCYIADARSPIAKNWISYFVALGHRVTVISSYPCALDELPGAVIIPFPFALNSFSGMAGKGSTSATPARLRSMFSSLHTGKLSHQTQAIRAWIASIQIPQAKRRLAGLLYDLQPDLVHAMRLPYEGFLAAAAVTDIPLLISIWGNDLTLFAEQYNCIAELTRSALNRADGLHCDCNRDLNLATSRWGFSSSKPSRVLPGNGGIHTDYYFNLRPDHRLLEKFRLPEDAPIIVNPRGFRMYVHNDAFFRAIPLVLNRYPSAFFVAPGMAGTPIAEAWVRKLGVPKSVRLLSVIDREQLANLLAACQVSVSPSSHDGTPNTLLEAMACGAFPVAGDLESIREWIRDGENGLLCNPRDPESLASSINGALADDDLRFRAKILNRAVIRAGADYHTCMPQAEALYEEVAGTRVRRHRVTGLAHSVGA